MDPGRVERDKLVELLLQALETEIRGAAVYRAALPCARKDELRDEWQAYLEQTEGHEHILTDLCVEVGVDPAGESPGREAVRHLGRSLVEAIEHVRARGGGELAELVAAECVVIAETKDRLNWEVIGEVARALEGGERTALQEAHGEVEDEEDAHLYHSAGWARELWLDVIGVPAVLPPPEEEKDVKTAAGAERARKSRTRMLRGR